MGNLDLAEQQPLERPIKASLDKTQDFRFPRKMRVHITVFRCVTPCGFIENTNVWGLKVHSFYPENGAEISREKFLSDVQKILNKIATKKFSLRKPSWKAMNGET